MTDKGNRACARNIGLPSCLIHSWWECSKLMGSEEMQPHASLCSGENGIHTRRCLTHGVSLQVMAASDEPAPAAKAASHEEDPKPDALEKQSPRAPGLTEAQLMEVFKQTSIFNVRSALANNHALMSAREIDEANDR